MYCSNYTNCIAEMEQKFAFPLQLYGNHVVQYKGDTCKTHPNKSHLALEWHGPLVGETGSWASPLPSSRSVGLATPDRVLLDQLPHIGRLL